MAVLEEPGRVRLAPWGGATGVLARIQELGRALDEGDPTAADSLLMLQDRYRRLSIEHDGRLHLPPVVAIHIDPNDAFAGFALFVVRYPQHVELWSTTVRERNLERAAAQFADLT